MEKSVSIQKILSGVDVLIATPGRCVDLIDQGIVNLHLVSAVVDIGLLLTVVISFHFILT